MGWIADHSLIEIAYLHTHFAVGIRQRPQIAGMAVAKNPHGRPFGERAALLRLQTLIELYCAPTDISVSLPSHFATTEGSPQFSPGKPRSLHNQNAKAVAQIGEPSISGFNPSEIVNDLSCVGLELVEYLGTDRQCGNVTAEQIPRRRNRPPACT